MNSLVKPAICGVNIKLLNFLEKFQHKFSYFGSTTSSAAHACLFF